MSFNSNASDALKKIVSELAPDTANKPLPVEHVSKEIAELIQVRLASKLFNRNFMNLNQVMDYINHDGFMETGDKKNSRNVILTTAHLPFVGIGEDSIFLNEHFAEGESLSSFSTLYDWDINKHTFNESFWEAEGLRPEGKNTYNGSLLWEWARWLEDGKLVYGNLSVANLHFQNLLLEEATSITDEHFPTTLKRECDDATASKGIIGIVYSQTPKDKAILCSIANQAANEIVSKMMREYTTILHQSGEWVSIERLTKLADDSISMNIVFSSPAAMKKARFSHWRNDLAKLPERSDFYEAIQNQAFAKLRTTVKAICVAVDKLSVELDQINNEKIKTHALEVAEDVMETYLQS